MSPLKPALPAFCNARTLYLDRIDAPPRQVRPLQAVPPGFAGVTFPPCTTEFIE